jgi:outer membrane receptor protein involved in Fe transport
VNVRDVRTWGVELGARKSLPGGAFVQAAYTGLAVEAASVTELSKYVLEYAPRGLAASGLLPLPGGVRLAPRVEYRRRSRAAGLQDYVLVDARLSRAVGRHAALVLQGANLLDASYEEITGVAMPGATMSVSLTVGGR